MPETLFRDRPRLRAFQAYLPPAAAALAALGSRCCHWPSGELDSDGFRFCAAPIERGCYCPAHRRLAIRGRR